MAMDGDAAPETEVPRVEDEVGDAGDTGEVEAGEAGEEEASGTQSKKRGKPGKRQYAKVTNLADFYAPAPYTSTTKGGGGKGKSKGDGKGDFKGDREDRKGKGKGSYFNEGEAASKGGEREKGAEESSLSVSPGPADGGDLLQAKGGASGKKKQGQFGSAAGGGGGKSREGGKDGVAGKGRGGGGKGGGAGQAQRKGGAQFSSATPGKGIDGPTIPGRDMVGGGADPDALKAPGPQQRTQLMVPKAGVPGPGGLVMAPPGAMPLHYGAMPAYGAMPGGQMAAIPYATAMPSMAYPMQGMAGMGIMPYYVMPQPNHAGMPPQPYMAAPPPQQLQQPPPVTPTERERLKTEMEKQIEYYFGMENLLKDVYLRKHMNEEGWVPISLLQGFPRIQQITHDPSILVDAITTSQLIEISPQNTHMRLKNEWPRWILAPQQGASAAPVASAAPQQRLNP